MEYFLLALLSEKRKTMRCYLMFLLLLISFGGLAQPFETTKTTELGIKPKPDENEIEFKPVVKEKTPTLSDFGSSEIPEPNFTKKEGKSIFEKPQFQTPNEGIADRLNKQFQTEDQYGNLEKFKRNQYFGDFRTDSKYIKLVYRDHLAFDGDRVQVIMNDRVIARDILLESSYKHLIIDLKIGFNKIEIVALNQGTSGPNTAEFQVYDDKGTLISSNQWELATGYKGTIILTKEE